MKKVLFLSLASVAILFVTGCMSFNDSKLTYKEYKPVKNKPVIEIQVERFYTTQVHGREVERKDSGYDLAVRILEDWKTKGFIEDYGNSEDLKRKADYVLALDCFHDEYMNPGLAFFSVLTLGIVPCDEQYTYDLKLKLIDQKTNKEYSNKIKASYTVWNSIIYLPALPFYWVGKNNMFTELSMHSYSEFRKQGAFKEKGGLYAHN